jgi:hypothetical protein
VVEAADRVGDQEAAAEEETGITAGILAKVPKAAISASESQLKVEIWC